MKELSFTLKGDRNYIQGPDVYNKILEFIPKNSQNFELSFHQIMTHNILLSEKRPCETEDLYFICTYENQGIKKELFGLKNPKSIPNQSFPYPEEKIIQKSMLDIERNKITLNNPSGFTVMEEIVALHKYLLQQILQKDKQGKWYFAKLQLDKIPKNNIYPLSLQFKINFNFLLAKSEIIFHDTDTISEKSIPARGGGFVYFGSKKKD